MFEKVNPCHPDKVADRIAGAIVDYAYRMTSNPKIAVEVLIGHGECSVITESSVFIDHTIIEAIVNRIARWPYEVPIHVTYIAVQQDEHLAANQADMIRCGDNGIFKGMPVTQEQNRLTGLANLLYLKYVSDGKYILDGDNLTICQSQAKTEDIEKMFGVPAGGIPECKINPLGEWTGGTDVDTGATNRKLGSDMGDSVTGGGLHGKDLSKADVSVNIYAFLKAQETGCPVELSCSIGDETVDGRPYSEIVDIARTYIRDIGGFERFAEWGLIRP